MCRHAQDILGWTGLKPACYKPRKSSFCFEQTAQTSIYFFHFLSWKAMGRTEDFAENQPGSPRETLVLWKNQHSQKKTCRDTAFVEKNKSPCRQPQCQEEGEGVLCHGSQGKLCTEHWFYSIQSWEPEGTASQNLAVGGVGSHPQGCALVPLAERNLTSFPHKIKLL